MVLKTIAGGLVVMRANKAVTIGRYEDQTVVLVKDPSPSGWIAVQRELRRFGYGDDAHLTQLGWWDGAELWRIEAS